jgi:hypothetical protein
MTAEMMSTMVAPKKVPGLRRTDRQPSHAEVKRMGRPQ